MTAAILAPSELGPRQTLAYFHQVSRDLPRPVPPLVAWNWMAAVPQPGLAMAFAVRDRGASLFGRIYMVPVELAHPILVKATLRRLQAALAAE